MDIEYLLLLQKLRDTLGEGISQAMSLLTKLSVSYWPIVPVLLIYWVWDRRAGRRMLGGFTFGVFLNGLLKVTCCVLRPWIRDPRVEPWGDARVAATGYSFPSGHSTLATALYGGVGMWTRRRQKALSAAFFALLLLTMFSRNYLGVHTPQDVLVGCAATALGMFVISKVGDWTDRKPSRDWIALTAAALVCAAAVLYYIYKPYPMVYDGEGRLLVDPAKLRADSFQGIGVMLFYFSCRIIERRAFRFDDELSRRTRLIIGLIAVVPGYFLFAYTKPLLTEWAGLAVGRFFEYSVLLLYGMVIVPLAMHICARRRRSPRAK